MDMKQVIGEKLGKRMAAFVWAAYQVTEAPDSSRAIMIVGLAMAYMVLQTISDREKGEKELPK
jgi:hypothetical protein